MNPSENTTSEEKPEAIVELSLKHPSALAMTAPVPLLSTTGGVSVGSVPSGSLTFRAPSRVTEAIKFLEYIYGRDALLEELAAWLGVDQPDADGWIEWHGGKVSPVPEGTKIDVRLGKVGRPTTYRDYDDVSVHLRWKHEAGGADIVAYRIRS
jgi:hypothetical protein